MCWDRVGGNQVRTGRKVGGYRKSNAMKTKKRGCSKNKQSTQSCCRAVNWYEIWEKAFLANLQVVSVCVGWRSVE